MMIRLRKYRGLPCNLKVASSITGSQSPLIIRSFYEKRSNKLQQKKTQLILYPQYVLSKEKKAQKNPNLVPMELPFFANLIRTSGIRLWFTLSKCVDSSYMYWTITFP